MINKLILKDNALGKLMRRASHVNRYIYLLQDNEFRSKY